MIQEKCEPVELPNSYLWNTQMNYISEPDNRGFGKGLNLQDLMARPDLVESGVENGHATDRYGERRLMHSVKKRPKHRTFSISLFYTETAEKIIPNFKKIISASF